MARTDKARRAFQEKFKKDKKLQAKYKKAGSEAMKKLWTDPEFRKKRSEHMKRLNERRKKDKVFGQLCQDRATEGRKNSEKFKQVSRDTLNRLRTDPDFQEAHSKAAAKRARRYGIASCRRSIPVNYRDRKGREFRFRSITECRFALLADLKGLDWNYEPISLPYSWKGRVRHYNPDFWVEQWREYVEVKGYETRGVVKQLEAVLAENPQITVRLWTRGDLDQCEAPEIRVAGTDTILFESFAVPTGG